MYDFSLINQPDEQDDKKGISICKQQEARVSNKTNRTAWASVEEYWIYSHNFF